MAAAALNKYSFNLILIFLVPVVILFILYITYSSGKAGASANYNITLPDGSQPTAAQIAAGNAIATQINGQLGSATSRIFGTSSTGLTALSNADPGTFASAFASYNSQYGVTLTSVLTAAASDNYFFVGLNSADVALCNTILAQAQNDGLT